MHSVRLLGPPTVFKVVAANRHLGSPLFPGNNTLADCEGVNEFPEQ